MLKFRDPRRLPPWAGSDIRFALPLSKGSVNGTLDASASKHSGGHDLIRIGGQSLDQPSTANVPSGRVVKDETAAAISS